MTIVLTLTMGVTTPYPKILGRSELIVPLNTHWRPIRRALQRNLVVPQEDQNFTKGDCVHCTTGPSSEPRLRDDKDIAGQNLNIRCYVTVLYQIVDVHAVFGL